MKPKLSRKCTKIAAVFAGLMLAGVATMAQGADKPKPATATVAVDDGSESVVVAGQTVAIDRKTGKLRQLTPEEAKALAAGVKAMLNRSTEGLTVVHHPNGTQSVDLQGRFQSLVVARANPDGTVSEKCVTNIDEASSFLAVSGQSSRTSTEKNGRLPARKVNRTAREGGPQ